MLNRTKKGISLAELVISALLLAVVMSAASGFAMSFFDVSYIHTEQMQNVNEIRSACSEITDDISNAVYIYPAGVTINLNSDITINTNNSVAMLFKENSQYGFTAYYIQNNILYQFTSPPTADWTNNTSPAENMLSFNGNITKKVISDIDSANTSLTYIMNYGNGITDSVLQGEISSVATNNVNALIKGIDWHITQSNTTNQSLEIKEFSKNVPRFIE